MLKTFIIGVFLGIAAAAGALYAYPAVDQHREASILSVATNGGTTESFHVNVPIDRILVGAQGRKQTLPAGMQWPVDEKLSDVRLEMFKLRNARDIVVGVAARTAAKEEAGDVIDWVLHLPARGSLYVNLQTEAQDGGFRRGKLVAGSREFATLDGSMSERWIADTSGDEDAQAGRIELIATYVGELEDDLGELEEEL